MNNQLIELIRITDSVKSCDCCGKSNLKKTAELNIDGEIVHYGVNCAARALGFTNKTYSARNASELESAYKSRAKVTAKINELKNNADLKAKNQGLAFVVTRMFSRGSITYGVESLTEYQSRNRFNVIAIYEAKAA